LAAPRLGFVPDVRVCTPTLARVIEVGPQREVSTINAALARAKVGDEIVLERGLEFPTEGLKVSVDAIEIRSADGPGEPAVIRNVSTAKSPTTIDHRGDGLLLKDLGMTGGGRGWRQRDVRPGQGPAADGRQRQAGRVDLAVRSPRRSAAGRSSATATYRC
jgi:hypothetical protein